MVFKLCNRGTPKLLPTFDLVYKNCGQLTVWGPVRKVRKGFILLFHSSQLLGFLLKFSFRKSFCFNEFWLRAGLSQCARGFPRPWTLLLPGPHSEYIRRSAFFIKLPPLCSRIPADFLSPSELRSNPPLSLWAPLQSERVKE